MKKLIVALAAAATLGGCFKVDKTPPKDLPAFVRVYPGAGQVVSMNVGGMSAMAFQAQAKPDDVINYYRTQAASDGLEEQPASAQGAPADQRQAMFQDSTGQKMMVIVAKPQGDGSMVSLTYRAPKAAS